MSYEITLEQTYPHPPERVWRALTDSAALAEWLMPNDFEPRVGHKFRFRSKPMPGWRGYGVLEAKSCTCLDRSRVQRTIVGSCQSASPSHV